MISVRELHYEFKQECDKIDSLGNAGFLPHQVDSYLNKGIRSWFNDHYDTSRDGRGFETTERQVERLGDFHVLSPQLQPEVIPINIGNGIYEVKLSDLLYNYAYITKVEINGFKPNCDAENMRAIYYRTNDVQNFYKASSWKWKTVYYSIGNSSNGEGKSIYINTANEFELAGIFISYLKWPVDVYFGGYNHINGQASYQSPSPPIDSDVDYNFRDEVVSYAVEQAKMDVGDNTWQISRNRIELNK